jgi:hypothetical protein
MKGIKRVPKRVPITKNGRLLVYVMQRLILKASNDYIQYGEAEESDLDNINKLIDRIQERLDRETQRMYEQGALF